MDDAIYYRDAGRFGILRRISANARMDSYRKFMSLCEPTRQTTILDIGVSDDEGPEANMLEKLHPWPAAITGAGLGSGTGFLERYGVAGYSKIKVGEWLPFDDKSFDIVWSNAVLEHVGGFVERMAFILEAARVARRLFLIVPNRWFPVEHHTAVPFLHWNSALFSAVTARTKLHYWADKRNVDFLSRAVIEREWPLEQRPRIQYSGLSLGPFSSNIIIECDLRQQGAEIHSGAPTNPF